MHGKRDCERAQILGQNGGVSQDLDHGQAAIAHHGRTNAVRAGARDRQDNLQFFGKRRDQRSDLLEKGDRDHSTHRFLGAG
jgi:hypothetical protein